MSVFDDVSGREKYLTDGVANPLFPSLSYTGNLECTTLAFLNPVIDKIVVGKGYGLGYGSKDHLKANNQV